MKIRKVKIMGNWLDLIKVLILGAALCGVVAAFLLEVFALLARKLQLNPLLDMLSIWALTLFPLLGAMGFAIAILTLSFAKAADLIVDHCMAHPGVEHLHFCLEHLPAVTIPVSTALVTLLIVSYPLIHIGQTICYELIGYCQTRQVTRLTKSRRFMLLPGDRREAIVVGLFSPKIIISTGLHASLTRRERRIVLAHEVSHLRNRDLVHKFLLRLFLSFHFPVTKQRLMKAWLLNREVAADRKVANRFGKFPLAKTLLKVMKQNRVSEFSYGLSVAGSDLSQRIEVILSDYKGNYLITQFVNFLIPTLVFTASSLVILNHHGFESMMNIIIQGH